MKPQALQDAIKLKASKGMTNRNRGGSFKDPYVKKYKITAEDIAAEKARSGRGGMAPMGTYNGPPIPLGGGGGGGAAAAEALKKVEQMRAEFIKDRDSILKEMKQLREEMKSHKAEMDKMQKENQKLKEQLKNGKSAPAQPSLEPHTPADFFAVQRKDKELREYMTKQVGLYPAKVMGVEIYDEKKMITFKKKLYLPAKLRKKTMEHYKSTKGSDWRAAIKKNFIWLEIDEDVSSF